MDFHRPVESPRDELLTAVDLGDAALNVAAVAGAFDQRGVFLVDLDLLAASEVVNRDAFEIQAHKWASGTPFGKSYIRAWTLVYR